MKIAQSVASEQGYREYMSKSGNIWFWRKADNHAGSTLRHENVNSHLN